MHSDLGRSEADGWTVERAGLADLAGIIALLADDPLGAGRETVSDPPSACYHAAFEAISADPNQLLAVVRLTDSAALAGCLQISFIPGLSRRGAWRAQIESVRIASGLRSRGIGRGMIGWAVAAARQRGCVLVQLTTDKSRKDAHRFYAALGFKASHEGMKLELAR